MKGVIVGSWIPRTKLHLEEFYDFTQGKFSIFNKQKGKQLLKKLNLTACTYKNDTIDYVEGKSKNVQFRFSQDGIIYVLGKSKKSVLSYYDKSLMPALGFIYKKGASVPKLLSDIAKKEHIIAHIGGKGKSSYQNIAHFEYMVFMKEFENALHNALWMHRVVWDDISDIRNREKIKFKDLPMVRDTLLEMKKNISFMKSRVAQMQEYIDFREDMLTPAIKKALEKTHNYDFAMLNKMNAYIKELMAMTEEYANSTLELVTLLYQENGQQELNTLQIIFTIGVVATFLTLGAMPGANILLKDAAGNAVLSGSFSAFSFIDLIQFGFIALLFGIVVYWILHFIFKSAKSFKIVSLVKKR